MFWETVSAHYGHRLNPGITGLTQNLRNNTLGLFMRAFGVSDNLHYYLVLNRRPTGAGVPDKNRIES